MPRKITLVPPTTSTAPAPSLESLVLPSHLSPDDLSYLQSLVQQQQAARSNAQCPVCASQTAINAFSGYLSQKYTVAQGESINLDGTILRKG